LVTNPDELYRIDREVVWHAFSQMADYDGLIIESGDGCWLTDIHGNRYLDGVSSLWCNVHGHRHPTIDAAVIAQLQRVAHVTSLGMSSPTTIDLAQRIVDLAPEGLEHVFFSSDGASAVEVAMKMAFQYWKQIDAPEPNRTTFLAVGNAYHGDTIGTVSVGGISQFHSLFQPLLFSVLRGPCPDTYRHELPTATMPNGSYCARNCDCSAKLTGKLTDKLTGCRVAKHYLDQYRRILEQHHSSIVAIIVEPLVQGAAGMVMHPPGFLRGLKELSIEFNTLLIADEVAVGMGRTGKLFACEHEDVSPDFLALGKGLTGGYLPMSATLTTSKVWQAFLGDYAQARSFSHGHTFGGNPLSAAAAIATLNVFEAEKTLEGLASKAAHLASLLEPLRDNPYVGDIRQKSLMAAIELVSDKRNKIGFPWTQRRGQAVCEVAKKHGVWLRPIGNVVIIMPPLSISNDELTLIVEAIKTGLHETLGNAS
jgi:adenosylmethionine-8-amino-7-oxononanoate aminotransferase